MQPRIHQFNSRPVSRRAFAGGLTLGFGYGVMRPWRAFAQDATPIASPVAAEFPRTVESALGPVTIPAAPVRVVTTSEYEGFDSLLALGIKPVLSGVDGGYDVGQTPWASAAGLDGIEFVAMEFGTPDIERIAAASPDLIVTQWAEADAYALLSGVAPTVDVKHSQYTPWNDVQRLVGAATGRDERAERVIAETLAFIAEQGARLAPYADLRIAVAYNYSGRLNVNGERAGGGRLLAAMGMTVFEPAIAPETEEDDYSLEQIGILDEADLIVSPGFYPAMVTDLERNPLFRSLPAVRNGRYVVVSAEDAQALYLESSLSLQWVAPRLADAVIEAAEGRGTRLSA